jgi:glucosamine-phosphate N-acetyltransferase
VQVRNLELGDYGNGFLETLTSLTTVGEIDQALFQRVFERIDADPGYHILVVDIDGVVAGSITLLVEQKFIHAGGLVGHIEDVVVRDDFQGRGLGKVLVESALTRAEEVGCYKVILDCSRDNVPFYTKCGFREREVEMRIDLPRGT